MTTVMDKLYDSEINFRISTFWDGGFDVFIGDEINGYKEQRTVRDWEAVEDTLHLLAMKHYPNSEYTKQHGCTNNIQ